MRTVVYLRFPHNRNGFEDPPPIDWDTTKERELWALLKSTSTDLEWQQLAEHFEVPVVHILQQAAWLYEKELGSLRRRMSRISPHKAPVPAPAPLGAVVNRADFSDDILLQDISSLGRSDSSKEMAPPRRLLSESHIAFNSQSESDLSDTSLDGFVVPSGEQDEPSDSDSTVSQSALEAALLEVSDSDL